MGLHRRIKIEGENFREMIMVIVMIETRWETTNWIDQYGSDVSPVQQDTQMEHSASLE